MILFCNLIGTARFRCRKLTTFPLNVTDSLLPLRQPGNKASYCWSHLCTNSVQNVLEKKTAFPQEPTGPMVTINMHRFHCKLGICMCIMPHAIGNIKTTNTIASAYVTGSLHSQVDLPSSTLQSQSKLKSTHMKQGRTGFFFSESPSIGFIEHSFTPGAPTHSSLTYTRAPFIAIFPNLNIMWQMHNSCVSQHIYNNECTLQ